jgi:hypothetical protein
MTNAYAPGDLDIQIELRWYAVTTNPGRLPKSTVSTRNVSKSMAVLQCGKPAARSSIS